MAESSRDSLMNLLGKSKEQEVQIPYAPETKKKKRAPVQAATPARGVASVETETAPEDVGLERFQKYGAETPVATQQAAPEQSQLPTNENALLQLLHNRQADSDTDAIWAGASGALGAILFGGYGDNAVVDTAIKTIDSSVKRKQSLQDQEHKYLIAKEKAKTGDKPIRGLWQLKPIELEGKTVYADFNTSSGELRYKGKQIRGPQVGFAQRIFKDPTTEEMGTASPSDPQNIRRLKGGAQKGTDLPKFTVKQQKELRGIRDDIQGDKEYQASRKAVSSANRAIALIQAGNPIAQSGLAVIYPRMFGEVGNLAAAEQARFSGSPEIMRKWETLLSKFTKGDLGERDLSDLMEVAMVMNEFDKRNINQLLSGYISDESSLGNLTEEQLIGALKGRRAPKFDPVSIAKKAKKKTAELPMSIRYMTDPDNPEKKLKVKMNAQGIYEEID